jgi:hypothetical protein
VQKRVFHIDQECFIIYAEDLSSKKERFLRVGNSDFLKDFGESLTFLTLLSPIYPGNPFKEIEIFRPKIDRKVVGLKNVVGKFLAFLKIGNIDIKKVEPIFAEDQTSKEGMTKKKIKLTEEEFLRKIKPDSKMVKHSFASFYSDGNVRIFNKKELIFDLKNMLSNTMNESSEIESLTSFYHNFYKSSYEKSGIIHSGKSVFIFSNHNFACISDSQKWVRDAIRVGIDPSNIDFLYITENIEPDSLWIKSFLKKRSDDKRIRLVLMEKDPLWIKLLPDEFFLPVYPDKDSIDIEIGNIKLFFQNNRINVFFDNLKLNFTGEKGFLDRGAEIGGEILYENEKNKFDIIIDDYSREKFTLFSYNPMIFNKTVNNTNYISEFFGNIAGFDTENCSFPILTDDNDYENNIVPDENEKQDFFTKLFFENIRRIFVENNEGFAEEGFLKYKSYLSDMTGNSINNNRLVIEQIFGISEEDKKPVMRNAIASNDFFVFSSKSNPYNTFQKEMNIAGWKEKLENLNIDKEEILNGSLIDKKKNAVIVGDAEKRIKDVIEMKNFFVNEREELKKFIKEVEKKEILQEIQRKEKEYKESVKQKAKVEKEPIIPNEDYSAKEILGNFGDKKSVFGKTPGGGGYSGSGSAKSGSGVLPKVLLGLVAAILVAMIIFGILFLKPGFNFNFVKDSKNVTTTTQQEFIDSMKKKYDPEKDKPDKQSYYYNFYMTMMDKWKLTNIVAVKSGYTRMLFPFEKRRNRGKDPDWIYPGNILSMPDDTKITVVSGDTMWKICETYLIGEINKDEISIRSLIEKTKTREMTVADAKKELSGIKDASHSDMVVEFIDTLLVQENFKGWEPKEPEKRSPVK